MSKTMIPYFSLMKNDERKSADIIIFGNIVSKGYAHWDELFPADVNSYDLVSQLNEISEDYDIVVHINSNGGEVKEGLAIYNALKRRNVTTICEGFAASAASLVFMGGKRRIMNAASLLFIHQASTAVSGNPDDLEKAASDLRTITEAAVEAYKEAGVTVSDDELMAMLKSESWIKAEEALEKGFATDIADTEGEEDGVVTNSAMPLIVVALTQKPGVIGEISVDVVSSTLEAAIKQFSIDVDRLESIARNTAPGQPFPVPKNQKKGFFNFTAGNGTIDKED